MEQVDPSKEVIKFDAFRQKDLILAMVCQLKCSYLGPQLVVHLSQVTDHNNICHVFGFCFQQEDAGMGFEYRLAQCLNLQEQRDVLQILYSNINIIGCCFNYNWSLITYQARIDSIRVVLQVIDVSDQPIG